MVFPEQPYTDIRGSGDAPGQACRNPDGFERASVRGSLAGEAVQLRHRDVFTPIIAAVHGRDRWQALRGLTPTRSPCASWPTISGCSRSRFADGALPWERRAGVRPHGGFSAAPRGFGRTLGMRDPFIYRLTGRSWARWGKLFRDIVEKQQYVERIIKAEEESFNQTPGPGARDSSTPWRSESAIPGSSPGRIAFKLYDTYGFPFDLTQLIASERNLKVDLAEFSS